MHIWIACRLVVSPESFMLSQEGFMYSTWHAGRLDSFMMSPRSCMLSTWLAVSPKCCMLSPESVIWILSVWAFNESCMFHAEPREFQAET